MKIGKEGIHFMGRGTSKKGLDHFRIDVLAPVLALIAVFVIFSLINPSFRRSDNLVNIVTQMGVPLLCGIGGTLIIVLGCIDLSVGGVIVISGMCSAALVTQFGTGVAFGLGVLVGLICGVINGALYVYLGIPSFVVTLAMSMFWNGSALFLSQAKPIPITDQAYRYPALGAVLDVPVIFVIAMSVLIIIYVWMKYFPIGHHALAIGGREEVAILSGIRIKWTKLVMFTVAGMLYGIAGVLQNGRLGAATLLSGEGAELNTIAAVVLGGTALTGGTGGVHRTIIGVAIFVILSNGLNVIGVSTYPQLIIKGIVLIIGVALTLDRQKVPIIK